MRQYAITTERNTPTLCIDQTPVPPVLFCLSDFPGAKSNTAYAKKNIENFAKEGINLVGADTGLHEGWRKSSPFEVEPLIEEISAVLDANPDAKILLRLHVNPPYWWLRDHPEECILYRTEAGDVPGIDDGEHPRLIRCDGERHMRVSLGSERWIKEASERITLFLEALQGTREGEALIAVQVACGLFGEWHQWGTDVSPVMCERFKQYLKEKYGTVEELQKAWHDPNVTFETAEYHPEVTFSGNSGFGSEKRPRDKSKPLPIGDDGFFRDPVKSQRTIDSLRCNQQTVAESILKLARVVKKVAPHLLCGTFYGYYLNTNTESRPVSGHLCVDMLHKARGVIDFLCGPYCYMRNRKSDKVPMQRALLESNRLRGMLWLTEMDDHPVGTEKFVGGDPAAIDETISRMRRETLQPLLGGMGFWFYDHRVVPSLLPPDSKNSIAASIYRKSGWWERPEFMEEVGNIRRFAEKITAVPYTPAADVLVVYDTDSYYYRAHVIEDEYELHDALMRSGVVFDCIYLKELDICDMSRYKCVIFVNCHMLTPEAREKCRRLTRGRLSVFMGNSGYCDGEGLSEENICATVGMKLKKIAGAESVALSFGGQEKMEIPEGYSPLFAVEEPDAEPIAFYDSGEVAAARSGEDVYLPTQSLTAELAAYLMKEAGVHRWCDSDEPVIAGYGYAALNCQRAGTRTLMLPGGKNIEVTTDGYETVVYDILSGERVL